MGVTLTHWVGTVMLEGHRPLLSLSVDVPGPLSFSECQLHHSPGPVALGSSVGETGAASGRLLPAVHVPGSPGWEGRVILLVDAFVGTSP